MLGMETEKRAPGPVPPRRPGERCSFAPRARAPPLTELWQLGGTARRFRATNRLTHHRTIQTPDLTYTNPITRFVRIGGTGESLAGEDKHGTGPLSIGDGTRHRFQTPRRHQPITPPHRKYC